MRPTIELEFIQIPLYTALVALGAVTGLVTAYLFLRAYSRRVYSLAFFLDAAIITFATGWIGARAYHVATRWDYYAARPDQIALFEAGGLAMRGAFVAGFVALALYARARAVTFGRLADAAALGLTVAQAIGWVGALMWGANYGTVSDSVIAMDLPDLYGIVEPRFPLQYVEITLFTLLFIVLLYFSLQRPEKGRIFLIYLLVASLSNFILGFFRGDEGVFVGVVRVDQIFDATLVVIALVVLLLKISTKIQVSPAVNAK